MTAEQLDPEDAFAVVGHEIRMDILVALWQAEESLSYSELQEAVGVEDNGQFNYHLTKLVGRFVGNIDDRYELLYPGHRILDAMRTGVFHESVEFDPVPVEGSCPRCECDLTFEHVQYFGQIRCGNCDLNVVESPFLPAAVEGRDRESVPSAFDRHVKRFFRAAASDVCPMCTGSLTTSLTEEVSRLSSLDGSGRRFTDDHPVALDVSCDWCSVHTDAPVGALGLAHPGLAGRLYEAGLDVRETPTWRLPFLVDPDVVSVSSDPDRVRIELTDDLRAYVDETPSVRRVEWVPE